MQLSILGKGWSLLTHQEQRSALWALAIVVLAALASAIMVGSIMPFLATLADPERIRNVEVYAWAYKLGGFQSDYGFLVGLGIASLVIIVLANSLQILRLYMVTKFATMRMHSLSLRLMQINLRQPYEYFLDKNTGEIGTQILAETQKVVDLFYRPVAEAIAGLLTAVAILSLLVYINPAVAMIAFITAGGLYFASYYLSRRSVRRFGDIRAEANKARFKVAGEALAGVKDIKLLGYEANYLDNFAAPSFRMARAEATAIFVGTLPQYIMQIVAFGGMILLVVLLLDPQTLHRSETIGELLPLLGVFAFGGQKLIPELAKVYLGITQVNYGAPVVESIHRDLAAEGTLPPLTRANIDPLGLRQGIRFENVHFRYPNAEKTSLAGVSLSIRTGERIGIAGGSGAGKTTLADVLMGLLGATEGRILIDDEALSPSNLRAWQRSVGYVRQDIFLSDTSIAENIALGVPRELIDFERVTQVARLARLDEFVRHELPDGYNTIVGERGLRLSGGQKQRIGIARALYRNADLIVFDEATSALDNVTERQVMDSIDALPGNKTAILIAHRLSTLEKCDRLIVMEDGKIVGTGTWGELLTENRQFKVLQAAGSVATD